MYKRLFLIFCTTTFLLGGGAVWQVSPAWAALNAKTKSVSDLRSTVSRLQEKVNTLSGQVRRSEQTFAPLQAQYEALKKGGNVAEIQARIKQLDDQITPLEQKIKSTQTNLNDLVSELEQNIQTAASSITVLEARAKQADEAYHSFKCKFLACETEMKASVDAKVALSKAKNDKRELESKLQETKAKQDQLIKSDHADVAALNELMNKREALEQKIPTLQTDAAELASFAPKYEKAKSALQKLKSELAAEKAQLEKLKVTLYNQQQKGDVARLKSLNDQIAAAKKRLGSLTYDNVSAFPACAPLLKKFQLCKQAVDDPKNSKCRFGATAQIGQEIINSRCFEEQVASCQAFHGQYKTCVDAEQAKARASVKALQTDLDLMKKGGGGELCSMRKPLPGYTLVNSGFKGACQMRCHPVDQLEVDSAPCKAGASMACCYPKSAFRAVQEKKAPVVVAPPDSVLCGEIKNQPNWSTQRSLLQQKYVKAIAAIQQKIGAGADGKWGPKSETRLSAYCKNKLGGLSGPRGGKVMTSRPSVQTAPQATESTAVAPTQQAAPGPTKGASGSGTGQRGTLPPNPSPSSGQKPARTTASAAATAPAVSLTKAQICALEASVIDAYQPKHPNIFSIQKTIGVTSDGFWGPKSKKKFAKWANDNCLDSFGCKRDEETTEDMVCEKKKKTAPAKNDSPAPPNDVLCQKTDEEIKALGWGAQAVIDIQKKIGFTAKKDLDGKWGPGSKRKFGEWKKTNCGGGAAATKGGGKAGGRKLNFAGGPKKGAKATSTSTSGETYTVELKATGDTAPKTYTITVESVTAESMTLNGVTIKRGAKGELDLDKDGKPDVTLNVDEISKGKAAAEAAAVAEAAAPSPTKVAAAPGAVPSGAGGVRPGGSVVDVAQKGGARTIAATKPSAGASARGAALKANMPVTKPKPQSGATHKLPPASKSGIDTLVAQYMPRTSGNANFNACLKRETKNEVLKCQRMDSAMKPICFESLKDIPPQILICKTEAESERNLARIDEQDKAQERKWAQQEAARKKNQSQSQKRNDQKCKASKGKDYIWDSALKMCVLTARAKAAQAEEFKRTRPYYLSAFEIFISSVRKDDSYDYCNHVSSPVKQSSSCSEKNLASSVIKNCQQRISDLKFKGFHTTVPDPNTGLYECTVVIFGKKN